MADALLPVPIYDHQYSDVTEICVYAKRIYPFSFDSNSKSFTVENFNIAIICSMNSYNAQFGQSYSQNKPCVIILPNASINFGLTFDGGDAQPMGVKLNSTINSISISVNHNSAIKSGVIAIID